MSGADDMDGDIDEDSVMLVFERSLLNACTRGVGLCPMRWVG